MYVYNFACYYNRKLALVRGNVHAHAWYVSLQTRGRLGTVVHATMSEDNIFEQTMMCHIMYNYACI